MAVPSITQIVASSYNAVLAKTRKPENQWAESAFMREMERLGAIQHEDFGPQIEVPLDWRRNPGAGFNATELEELSGAKTEVITAAQYAIAELSVPIVITRKDEVQNPSENQKIKLAASLSKNAIDSHDDLMEEALFAAATTQGFNSLPVLIPTGGQGSPGGIDAATLAFWRNAIQQYTNATDIVANLTTLWNEVIRGSGSTQTPKFLVSGSTPHAQYESTQQGLIRYMDQKEADAGFKILAFKTARYSFSQYGGTSIYMGSPTTLMLKVSKGNFRDLGESTPLQLQNGKFQIVYSAVQLVTSNKSRLGVCYI